MGELCDGESWELVAFRTLVGLSFTERSDTDTFTGFLCITGVFSSYVQKEQNRPNTNGLPLNPSAKHEPMRYNSRGPTRFCTPEKWIMFGYSGHLKFSNKCLQPGTLLARREPL